MDTQVLRCFANLKSILAMDEVNALTAGALLRTVNGIYADLAKYVRFVLLKVARHYYGQTGEPFRDRIRKIDEEWIDYFLTTADPVSKYIFANEEKRKRSRLFESLIVSKTPAKDVDAAAKSLALMYRIYTVRVAEEAAIRAMKDDGILQVQWISEKDGK